jgi:hypothetical protein
MRRIFRGKGESLTVNGHAPTKTLQEQLDETIDVLGTPLEGKVTEKQAKRENAFWVPLNHDRTNDKLQNLQGIFMTSARVVLQERQRRQQGSALLLEYKYADETPGAAVVKTARELDEMKVPGDTDSSLFVCAAKLGELSSARYVLASNHEASPLETRMSPMVEGAEQYQAVGELTVLQIPALETINHG